MPNLTELVYTFGVQPGGWKSPATNPRAVLFLAPFPSPQPRVFSCLAPSPSDGQLPSCSCQPPPVDLQSPCNPACPSLTQIYLIYVPSTAPDMVNACTTKDPIYDHVA